MKSFADFCPWSSWTITEKNVMAKHLSQMCKTTWQWYSRKSVYYMFLYMFDNVYNSWNVSYEFPLRENIKWAEVGTAQESPNSIWTVTPNTGKQRALSNRLANQEQKLSKEQFQNAKNWCYAMQFIWCQQQGSVADKPLAVLIIKSGEQKENVLHCNIYWWCCLFPQVSLP